MPHRPNFTAELPNKELIKQAVAAVGATQTRGKEKGHGSIREFLCDIGAGEIWFGYTMLEEPRDMRRAAKRVAELAHAEPDEQVKELLVSFSGALADLARNKAAFEKWSEE